jgi:hypothetical protein
MRRKLATILKQEFTPAQLKQARSFRTLKDRMEWVLDALRAAGFDTGDVIENRGQYQPRYRITASFPGSSPAGVMAHAEKILRTLGYGRFQGGEASHMDGSRIELSPYTEREPVMEDHWDYGSQPSGEYEEVPGLTIEVWPAEAR